MDHDLISLKVFSSILVWASNCFFINFNALIPCVHHSKWKTLVPGVLFYKTLTILVLGRWGHLAKSKKMKFPRLVFFSAVNVLSGIYKCYFKTKCLLSDSLNRHTLKQCCSTASTIQPEPQKSNEMLCILKKPLNTPFVFVNINMKQFIFHNEKKMPL